MARTTPAQKPRGEHKTTLSGGFSASPARFWLIGERRFRAPTWRPITEMGVGRLLSQAALNRLPDRHNFPIFRPLSPSLIEERLRPEGRAERENLLSGGTPCRPHR